MTHGVCAWGERECCVGAWVRVRVVCLCLLGASLSNATLTLNPYTQRVAMGIIGDSLIKLCTLMAWCCDFSEVMPEAIAKPGETPTAVIDGNCWVYECACGISSGLSAEAGFRLFDKFLFAYKKRLLYVQKCGWTPIIVFDGRRLPLKSNTHLKREEARKKARKKAEAIKQVDPSVRTSDLSTFHPTHDLIHRLVLALRQSGYEVIVAPHEGDPQCAFLANTGKAHIVITRDSDLIAHGCPIIFFWNRVYHPGEPGGFGGKFYYKRSLFRCAQGIWKPIIRLGSTTSLR